MASLFRCFYFFYKFFKYFFCFLFTLFYFSAFFFFTHYYRLCVHICRKNMEWWVRLLYVWNVYYTILNSYKIFDCSKKRELTQNEYKDWICIFFFLFCNSSWRGFHFKPFFHIRPIAFEHLNYFSFELQKLLPNGFLWHQFIYYSFLFFQLVIAAKSLY